MLAKVSAAVVAATAASAAPAAAGQAYRTLTLPQRPPPPSIVIQKGVKLIFHNHGLNYNVFFGMVAQGSGSNPEVLGSVAVVNYADTKSTEILIKQLQASPATCTIANGVAQVSLGEIPVLKCIPKGVFNDNNILSTVYPYTPPISDYGATIIGNQKT